MQITVEVVYASAAVQTVIAVTIADGATIGEAIAVSGIVSRHPEIDLEATRVGIFGRCKPLSAQPADGDRIEIYRKLSVDPKQSRRIRGRRKQVAQKR